MIGFVSPLGVTGAPPALEGRGPAGAGSGLKEAELACSTGVQKKEQKYNFCWVILQSFFNISHRLYLYRYVHREKKRSHIDSKRESNTCRQNNNLWESNCCS